MEAPYRSERETDHNLASSATSKSPDSVLRSWATRSALILGLVTVAAIALVVHLVLFLIESQQCAVGFDTGSTPPAADASPQGWLCSEHASGLGPILWTGGFLTSVLITVAATVYAWRKLRWWAIFVAFFLLVFMPILTSAVMNAPPDDCSAAAKASHPRWACVR